MKIFFSLILFLYKNDIIILDLPQNPYLKTIYIYTIFGNFRQKFKRTQDGMKFVTLKGV